MEFEWKIFPGFTAVAILNEIQQMMGESHCEPENFTGRIMFMSMFNDIVWDVEGNDELCLINSKTIKEYAERFPRGHWSFLGRASEKKWYGTYDCKPDGSWNRTAEKNAGELRRIRSSDIPWYQCLGERRIKTQRRRKYINTLDGSTQNIELLLKMVISINQLSLYGAVADTIEELPVGRRAPGTLFASGQQDKQEFLTQLPLFLSLKCTPMKSDRETCCKNTSNDLRNYQKTRIYPTCVPKQV